MVAIQYQSHTLPKRSDIIGYLINAAPLADALHWSKNLLPADPHAVFHIAEYSWLNKVALPALGLATTPVTGHLSMGSCS